MPQHAAEPQTDPPVCLVDQLVISAPHEAGAPVVRHVLAGQQVLLGAAPEADGPPEIMAEIEANPVRSHPAPADPGAGIDGARVREQ
ncbi:hypothetical protein D3C79_748820 [compost metagenome]